MAAKQKIPTQNGVILSYEETARLQAQEDLKDKLNPAWGFGDKAWYPWQRGVLTSLIDEIGMFGGVGGGKTAVGIGWLISGNPHLPDKNLDGTPNLVNLSYMHHPGYAALVLRKNEKDLWQFLRRAQDMFEPLGISYINGEFRHPMGGVIVCGHMADSTSWQKYLGNEYVRIFIDEAPLIPNLGLYEELRARLRTVFPELRPQILLAGNYGGPGSGFLSDRFMTVDKPGGGKYLPGEVIEETIEHPITHVMKKRTRIWVFTNYKSNPKFRDSESYPLILASIQDPKRRAAYMDGEWNVFSGSFFGDTWRSERKLLEPANACHVVRKADQILQPYPKLEPWFPRAIGMDWGFRHEAAIYWLAQHGLTSQLNFYREMVVSGVSSERLGYELARLTLDELNASPDHSITLHLSHDAFQKRDAVHSTVELIARGIARIVGPQAVHIPDLVVQQLNDAYARGPMPSPAEEKAREEAIQALYKRRIAGITIRVAPKISTVGWQYMRDLMRWDQIITSKMDFDIHLAMQLLMESQERYQEYVRACKPEDEEILPKLLVWDTCPRLIDAIPRLQYKDDEDSADDQHFRGKDSVDAAHYTLVGFRDEHPPEPFEAFRDKRLNAALAAAPPVGLTTNDLIWLNRYAEKEWKEREEGPISFSVARGGRTSRGVSEKDLLM